MVQQVSLSGTRTIAWRLPGTALIGATVKISRPRELPTLWSTLTQKK